ncbi:hypothetical protein D0T84_18565 [Dysgonomonas sp. 521]|uniref:hypothetical protein n=1 Tax=Dysgonomonas sp. 521 TaxID=2302932 RepID=UPI0013D457AC|nr:hypothetical protein [Dysgonomonas sp. 521]NDV96894.1 hypothetical protein [Dysgonomonas sp. 521]
MNQILAYIQIAITVLLLYPVGRLFFKYLKIFIWYMFNTPITWWNKEVEKPRLLFFIFGIFAVIISWKLFLEANSIFLMILSLLINLIGILTLFFVWTSKFELRFIQEIKEKLLGKKIYSPYSKGYDLQLILNRLDFIKCDLQTFQDLLSGNKISPEKKIVCRLPKIRLIRFVFIVFHFNHQTNPKVIKEVISHYFLNEKGEQYSVQEKASEISTVFGECIREDDIYSSFKSEIDSVFQWFRNPEP